MCFWKRKPARTLETKISGLTFRNPVGLLVSTPGALPPKAVKAGFITLTPPLEEVLPWITSLQENRPPEGSVLLVNISTDIPRTFALAYDFADLLVIDPDPSGGISSPDVSDITALLDQLLSLRLCYEKFTPIYLRMPKGITQDELESLLSYCQLSGIDGVIAPSLRILRQVRQQSLQRIPVAGATEDIQTAREMLQEGAVFAELANARPIPILKLIKSLDKND